MTKEKAKQMAEVLNAYAEGKPIEVLLDGEWGEVDLNEYSFDPENESYRIKKEPKYRPFKNAKECFEEMKKHYPIGWICRGNGFQQITKVGATYIEDDEYIHFFVRMVKVVENMAFTLGKMFKYYGVKWLAGSFFQGG